MALKAGGKTEATPITGSTLAELIERAFETEWNEVMKKTDGTIPDKPKFNDQTRLLFVAVAQGVVKHLLNNDLRVTIKIDGSTTTQTGTLKITS